MNDNCKDCEHYLLCIVGEFKSIFGMYHNTGGGDWSQICSEHLPEKCPKIDGGSILFPSKCGIKGCNNPIAKFVIDI